MSAIVLVSGGLDSAVALAIARQSEMCHTLTFDYGQRHSAELKAANRVVRARGLSIYVHGEQFTVKLDGIAGSALTDADTEVPKTPSAGIPSTYVPARNTVFLAQSAENFLHPDYVPPSPSGAHVDWNAGFRTCAKLIADVIRHTQGSKNPKPDVSETVQRNMNSTRAARKARSEAINNPPSVEPERDEPRHEREEQEKSDIDRLAKRECASCGGRGEVSGCGAGDGLSDGVSPMPCPYCRP